MLMKSKHFLIVALSLGFLTGCGNLDKGITNINEGEETASGSITTGRVDNSVYQAVMTDGKYQPGIARGLNAERMNSGFNQSNFENGLLRLSKETFPVDSYYFQEGQKIPADTIKSWLKRVSDENPQGLNPEGSDQPIIFQQLMEQDFIEEDGKTLAGIGLGFAFNTVYYGADETINISRDEWMANARKTVNAVLTQTRKIKGLENVPIVIGLFEQAAKDNIAGGNYVYQAVSQDGGTVIDQFEKVDEAHVLLPVASGTNNAATDDGLDNKFKTFRDAILGFFPDLSGVSGKAYYVDGKLQKLILKVESNYYSKTEITSFVQYSAKQVESVFKDVSGDVEVQINSMGQQQAFIAREEGQEKIATYVFN
jgi:protein involved in sex pheromone biosynthesis